MKRAGIILIVLSVIFSTLVICETASYAAETHPWGGWTRQNASYSGSTLTMDTLAVVNKTINIVEDYTVKFSMRVEEWAEGSYQGVYFCNGKYRSGIYVFKNELVDFSGHYYKYNTDTNWHDYRLEVKGDTFGIYVDNVLVATGKGQERSHDNLAYFFTSAKTVEGSVKVKNFSIGAPDGSNLPPLYLTAPVETEYAQEFTTNWAQSTAGWTITDCDEIFVNDKGNIEIKVKDKGGYYQVERAPKTPANFDVEYGLQVHNFGGEAIGLKVAANGYNNYHYLSPDRFRGITAETTSTGGCGFLTDIGYEWHNWKFEVRGAYITVYIDGGQVARYRMQESKSQTPLIRVITESVGNENCHLELGNIHYKPYFLTEELVSPENGAEYTEGGNITFKAKSTNSAEYIDYFVNGICVGRGYAPDYEYVLKNIKPGSYRVSAGIGKKGDVENIIRVNPKNQSHTAEGVNSDREYMLDYSFSGSDGVITVCDGYFMLNMKHSSNNLTVDTKGGKELFNLGCGTYRVVTTSGYATVYHNGHFAGSFLMPRTDKSSVEHSGVSDFVKSESGVKKLIFEEKWQKKSEYRKSLENIGFNYSVEFDKTDLSDEVINVYDGYYKIDLSMEGGELTATAHSLQGIEERIVLDGEVRKGYWRITVAKGLAQVWCDNAYIDSFALPANPRPAEFVRIMENSFASTIVAVKNTDDLFYHNEDFEGNGEIDAIDYWLPDGDGAKATVENGEMKIEGRYLLNGQSYDSRVKWSAKIDDATDFYVATRLFKNWYDVKVGYDFTKGTWYISQWSDYSKFERNNRVEYSGNPLKAGKWYDFELIVKGESIELLCDGVSVAKKEDLDFPFNGYTGFGTVGGTVTIDNVEYQGRCAVTAAVKTATISDKVGIAEIWEDKNGAVYIQAGNHIVTTDGGETWSDYIASRATEHRLRLNDGRLLEIRFNDLTNPPEAWVSSDDGKNWTRTGYLCEDDNQRRVILTGSITQAKNGRVFVCSDHGYSEYGSITKIATYYSDDLKNWYMSPSVNDSGVSGLNLQEGSHVELPDGTIRWYARSGMGFIMYCDSTDNGATFGEWKPSQFIAPLCTYAVERDNKDDNTYWAIMQYDATTYDYRYIHKPRNRFALMVSYDGMESWEFVATLNEQGEFPTHDACNHVLRVFGDTVYIQWNNLYAPRRSITYAIDKSKVRTQKRFEEVHERTHWGESSGSMTDTICILPKSSGIAHIYGMDGDAFVCDGRYDVKTIEKVFGVWSRTEGKNVTFLMGNSNVTFTEDSNVYSVNGESGTFGSVCLSKGYLDINACAEAFGKNISDMGDSFILWENQPASNSYLDEFSDYVPSSGNVVEDMTGTMFGDKHLIFVQDYDSNKNGVAVEAVPGSAYDYYDDILKVVDDGSGNKVLDITVQEGSAGHSLSLDGFATSQAMGSEFGFDINMKNGVVVTYDIMKKENGAAIGVEIADNDDGGRGIAIISPDSIPEMNKWYTVETRMADGRTPQVMVYDRETGIGKEVPCVVASNIIGSGNFNRLRIVSDSRYAEFNNNITKESGKNVFTTHYLMDNVKLYNQTAKRTSGIILSKDYESQPGTKYEYAVSDAGVLNISNGYEKNDEGTYYTIERTLNQSHTWVRYNLNGDITTMPTDNYQVTLDAMKMTKSRSLSIQLCSTAGNWDGWIIPANDVEVGVWYTYKFVEENGVKKAYRKVKGEEDFAEIAVVTDDPDNYDEPVVKSKPLQISSSWKNYVLPAIEATQGQVGNDGLYGDSDGVYATGVGSKWAIDNFVVAQMGAGETEHLGEFDKVYNKLNVWSSDVTVNEFMPVIAYYDSKGNLIGTDFAGNSSADFGKGVSQMFMSYTGGTLFQKIKDEGGSIRAYFWSADGKPIAKEIDITNVF